MDDDAGSSVDAGAGGDAGTVDAGAADAGVDDAGPVDAGACVPATVTGTIQISPIYSGRTLLEPGGEVTVSLIELQAGPFGDPIALCETWAVAPLGQGVTIDADSGLVLVADSATFDEYTVTATYPGGEVTGTFKVIDPTAFPFRGNWTEVAQIDCTDDSEVAPEVVMEELSIRGDGLFTATWLPFEFYTDYAGSLTVDGAGGIEFVVSGGNYVPDDVDGVGTFEFQTGRLILRDIWLGTPQDGTGPARCGHIFE